jgi:hypothetical protein
MPPKRYWYETDRNTSTTLPQDARVPEYYIGNTERTGKYQARYVVSDFDCSYNVGSAVTYCLRSKRKHVDGGIECLTKAIAHLEFEIEKLKSQK